MQQKHRPYRLILTALTAGLLLLFLGSCCLGRYYNLFYHCELTQEQFDALVANSKL